MNVKPQSSRLLRHVMVMVPLMKKLISMTLILELCLGMLTAVNAEGCLFDGWLQLIYHVTTARNYC